MATGRASPSPRYSGDYSNGDDQFALNVVASISGRISDLHMTDNEELCTAALSFSTATSQLLPENTKNAKKGDKRKSDFFQKQLTLDQARNQQLRFRIGPTGGLVSRASASWNFFNLNMDTRDQDGRRDYEDVVDPDILNAPICDVCIVQAKTMPPPGYYRIHKTPTYKKADLNTSSGGNPLYLCIKKDLSGTQYPITNFIVVFPDRNEYTPPGFVVVNRGKTACNLNSGTSAERIILCYRKEPNGNPIIDLQPIMPGKGETPPASFNVIEKSISGSSANLNTGTGGAELYLTYRQKMSRLNCLLHEPSAATEEDAQSRLRLRRNTQQKSFDEAEKIALGAGDGAEGAGIERPASAPLLHAPATATTPGPTPPPRPVTINIQPVAIHTLAGQANTLRLRAASTMYSSGNTMASTPQRSGSLMAAAVSTASAQGGPQTGHGALPQSMLYSMPQLPPSRAGALRTGSGSPATPGMRQSAGVAGGVGTELSPAPVHSPGLTSLNAVHSVSFSESLCDSPHTATSSVHPFDPNDPCLSPAHLSAAFSHGTSLGAGQVGTLSNSTSVEGFEEGGGRERAASTSTTLTGAHHETMTNDTESRAGNINFERGDSDVLSLAPSVAGGTGGEGGAPRQGGRTLTRRASAYVDYEAPCENMGSDEYGEEDGAHEMAYLLEQMQQSRRLEVVDCYGNAPPLVRRRALLAILSALYIRQGTVANAALAGLGDLLRASSFFATDLQRLPPPGAVTMFDLTIEAVCDRFELSADGERDALLKFLGLVTPYCGSTVSLVSLQKIFFAVANLCCHYAITQPALLEASLGTFLLDADNYDDYETQNSGMPSFKLLAQLLRDIFGKIEVEDIAAALPSPSGSALDMDDVCSVASSSLGAVTQSTSTTTFATAASTAAAAAASATAPGAGLTGFTLQSLAELEVADVVDAFVEEVLDGLEMARLGEVALLTVSKQSYSTISPPFWKELHGLAYSLFEGHGYRSAFLILGAICKQAWHTVRTKNAGEPVARDVGVKLVALGALEQFCLLVGDNMRSSKVFGYQVRRIVVPCLLYNVSFAFMDHRIFSKVLRIITALWRNWRRHVRMEFAILCEQFIFRVMQATVVQVRPIFKMIMIQEVTKWFEQPHLLLEMFVNYDMDRKFVSHWNTFSYLVRTFCAIGRRVIFASKVVSEEDGAGSGSGSGGEDTQKQVERSVTIRDVHMQALEEVGRIAKTLMDASGHAFLILQDSVFRNKSIGQDGGWTEDDDGKSPPPSNAASQYDMGAAVEGAGYAGDHSPGGTVTVASADSGVATQGTTETTQHRRRMGSIKMKRAAHQQSEALIKKAIEIYHAKGDLKKAVDFLIKNQFLSNTPQEIANFLRLYKNSFDPAAIGEFLGEGGKTPQEEEYWSNIRFRYTRAVSFVEMDIEPALRLYLTGCGFRMPGEAQKINRFVEVFVKAFWQDNCGTENCPFKKEDTVHLLAYAIILLNTDLNNVNLDKKGKKRQRMSKEDFFKQLRGCDDGNDIDKAYLSRIYDNIAAQAIELVVRSPVSKATDESVTNPQFYSLSGVTPEIRAAEEKKFVREMCASLRDSEDLLRSLSNFSYPFVETKISMDLVSFMFESVWFHFHATAEALLHSEATDIFVKIAALDILSYALTCSIFLDLKVERMTLAGLLNDFRIVCEGLPYASNVQRSPKIPDNSWYEDVENAFASKALETISKLHHLFVYLKDILQENEHYEKTRQVADQFEKKARIMENNLYFVRQGELSKMSRGKRPTTYWFFLFSDQLIYAHVARGQYVVHEELSLLDLQVSDYPADPTMCSFFVEHPVKSFQVTAESPSVKQAWMRDIAQTIASCRRRKQLKSGSGSDPRRMSMIGRIESQKLALQQEQDAVKRAQERAHVYKADGEVSPMSPLTNASSVQHTSISSHTALPLSTRTPSAGSNGIAGVDSQSQQDSSDPSNSNSKPESSEHSSARSPFQDLRRSAKQSLYQEDDDEEDGGDAGPAATAHRSPTASQTSSASSALSPGSLGPGTKLSGIFATIDA